MTEQEEPIIGLIQEMRRGTIIIGVLSQLFEPRYGYALVDTLDQKGLGIDPGTLYPLLRRLEKQNLLESKWDTNEARPRKYYVLSATGRQVYAQVLDEWKQLVISLNGLIGGEEENGK
jgi:PadR family transcriptional regulator, regulatory protein PadR